MVNVVIKRGRKLLMKGGKVVLGHIAPDFLNSVTKIGNDIIEHQKNLVKIPDLKDVHIDEALRVLKDELNLRPTSAIATPSLGYADGSENNVVYSVPRFGSQVNPKAIVKVYYLTQEVIDKSKELLENKVQEFKVPVVIGLNLYEAREDLENLGLKVTEKLEKSRLKFTNKEDGQVTRITYPNNHKIGSKVKTGTRIFLYYVNEEVILESNSRKDKKDKNRQEKIDTIGRVAKNIRKPLRKKKRSYEKKKK
jgi:beta-lactam-binding protein with PASTA domain